MKKFLIGLLLCAAGLVSQTASAQYAGRIEVLAVPSMTLSTTQFLTGKTDGKPVTLAGELRLPPATPGTKFPVMVMVHGSSGIGINVDQWAHELNSIGVGVFLLDSFSGRGITNTVADQGQLDHFAMLYDAYRALDMLASHPMVDARRIGIMGFSKGGVAGVYAAMDRFNNAYGSKKARFATYMAFYPVCYQYRDDEKVDHKPIRIFHGEADDYVPIAPCRDYAERLKAKGADITVTGYPDSYHGFDAQTLPPKFFLAQAQQAVKCHLVEGEGGNIINTETGKPLTRGDACTGVGATVGYNKAAHQTSIDDVKREVKAAFDLSK